MSESYVDSLLAVLNAVTTLTGLNVVWKDLNGLGEGGCGPEIYQHCNAFCTAVKSTARGMEACKREDVTLTNIRAREDGSPFLRTCHAGVTELIVPLYDSVHFDGVLFVGTVRRDDDVCRCARAIAEFAKLPDYDEEVFDAVRKILCALAVELASRKRGLRLRKQTEKDLDPRIAEAIRIIRAGLKNRLRAAEVAEACCLSPSRFVHLFKDSVGTPFSNYVIVCRIEKAKSLLTFSDMPMHWIAAETGFPNQNYFATVFKREAGVPPGRYRRQTQVKETQAP